LLPIVESKINDAFSQHAIDILAHKVRDITVMSVELGSVDILELVSPKRFTDPIMCSELGLRPGFAVDCSECKPYGPNVAEYWDLNTPKNIKALQEVIDYDEPFLLTGLPPCDPSFQVFKISPHRRDLAKVEQRRKIGVQTVRIGIKVYEHQYNNTLFFFT